jgi:tRNA-splicing ligase RtcB
LGHQVCDDALDVMQTAARKYELDLPDRQLACAPVSSPEGRGYYAQMACAANYAWANRQAIMCSVREVFEGLLGQSWERLGLSLVWDVAHNIAKLEEHDVNGHTRRLCVHRKGATRAWGPDAADLPARYRPLGQPVIVPGDMGTGSWVMLGTETAMTETWGSTCHGAGRQMSRKAALKRKHSREVFADLKDKGILLQAANQRTVAEEMPEAYKDVDQVVRICEGAGLSRRVARLRPLAVIKG